MLLTVRYLRSPSFWVFLGIAVSSEASIMFHNYSLLAVLAIPLYALLLGVSNRRRAFWELSGVIFLSLLVFVIAYLNFANLGAVKSINKDIFSSIPGWSYWFYCFLGSLSYPFCHVFWGGTLSPIKAFILGMLLFGPLATLILLKGKPNDNKLALWALILNALPVLLVGLGRHQMSLLQAGMERYGIFSLVGTLFVVGISWGIISKMWLIPPSCQTVFLTWALFVMVCLQLFPTPQVLLIYREWNQEARNSYIALKAQGVVANPTDKLLCPGEHPFLTKRQAMDIYRFLVVQQ